MASRKVDFALAERAAATAFAEAIERIAELYEIYYDSGYDPGGSDSIIDGDIEGHNMAAQDLTNFATFAENLALFMSAGTPMVFDYQSKVNAFREM